MTQDQTTAQFEGNFVGHEPRECGEHRTVGPHRAWCLDCTEWCYPNPEMACKGCELARLRGAGHDQTTTDNDEDEVARLARVFTTEGPGVPWEQLTPHDQRLVHIGVRAVLAAHRNAVRLVPETANDEEYPALPVDAVRLGTFDQFAQATGADIEKLRANHDRQVANCSTCPLLTDPPRRTLRAFTPEVLVRIRERTSGSGLGEPWVMNKPEDGWASRADRWTWRELTFLEGWRIGRRHRDEHSDGFWLVKENPDTPDGRPAPSSQENSEEQA